MTAGEFGELRARFGVGEQPAEAEQARRDRFPPRLAGGLRPSPGLAEAAARECPPAPCQATAEAFAAVSAETLAEVSAEMQGRHVAASALGEALAVQFGGFGPSPGLAEAVAEVCAPVLCEGLDEMVAEAVGSYAAASGAAEEFAREVALGRERLPGEGAGFDSPGVLGRSRSRDSGPVRLPRRAPGGRRRPCAASGSRRSGPSDPSDPSDGSDGAARLGRASRRLLVGAGLPAAVEGLL